MEQADRLLTIGCAAVAIGLALAVFGAIGSSRDWVISSLGLALVVSALPTVAVASRAKRRGATMPQTRRVPAGWRAIISSYVEAARQSRKGRVLAALGALWIVYNVSAFVVSIARSRWSYALVYGVVAAALPVLAYVRAAAPKSPTT